MNIQIYTLEIAEMTFCTRFWICIMYCEQERWFPSLLQTAMKYILMAVILCFSLFFAKVQNQIQASAYYFSAPWEMVTPYEYYMTISRKCLNIVISCIPLVLISHPHDPSCWFHQGVLTVSDTSIPFASLASSFKRLGFYSP